MSDDEDYMSDKFLLGLQEYKPPSLLHRHADKREMELLKKKAEIEEKLKKRNKPIRVIEAEKREEGLSSALSADNKGFEMLMKMGYKPGQGIGKSESGISEPIGVDVRSSRIGLGRAEKKKVKPKSATSQLESLNTNDFRGRIAQKTSDKLSDVDLSKSQRVCEQLDKTNEVAEPKESWFWPKVEKTTEETENEEQCVEDELEEEDNDALSTSEKLETLTKYLREKYYYCIWCGTTYNSTDDLRDNCPGATRNDH